MSITLYELAGQTPTTNFSPHCWKTRLTLNYKNLPYQQEPVRFTEKDKIGFTNQPLVPVITEGDQTVNDSWAIANYLEEKQPEPTLFPQGKDAAEAFNQWCNSALAAHIRPIVLMDIYQIIGDDQLEYFRTSREKMLGTTLEEFTANREQSLLDLRKELEPVRERLQGNDFLNGTEISYDDISLMGMLMWIASTGSVQLFADDDTVMQGWFERMLEAFPEAKASLFKA